MRVKVIGGGLAGSEACYQLLKRGFEVDLYEMRPVKMTPCHSTGNLAELVCSNSLKSMSEDSASGMLKAELNAMDSLLIRMAGESAVPAGSALAVDREIFSSKVTKELSRFDGFRVINEEISDIDVNIPTIVASGPLTSDALSVEINRLTGDNDNLHFYDAVAPIVSADSIDTSKIFPAARYNKGEASDYLNAGMTREEYDAFYDELINGERVILKEFEKGDLFESCMPIEEMARRGKDTLRFGMLKPVGIVNPNSGERYYAVVQLRKENVEATMYNLVGFQTNLTFKEQKRIFSMISGLEKAEFLRYGVMHRNTFMNSPKVLSEYGCLKDNENIFFAGQITGVEGYVESIMSGLIAGVNMARKLRGLDMLTLPNTTVSGGLLRHVFASISEDFEPMNANFGILPEIKGIRDKKERKRAYFERGVNDIKDFIEKSGFLE